MLMAVCHELGVEDSLIPRIAAAFAGGMAGQGEVCGAVVGSLMCVGLKADTEDPMQRFTETARLGSEIMRAFREEMGSLRCRELTGLDLSTPDGQAALMSSDVPVRVCFRAVGFAYEETLKLLKA